MKELEKNLEATGGVPAEAELAAINRFAKSPPAGRGGVHLFPATVRQRGGPGLGAVRYGGAQHTGRPVRGGRAASLTTSGRRRGRPPASTGRRWCGRAPR